MQLGSTLQEESHFKSTSIVIKCFEGSLNHDGLSGNGTLSQSNDSMMTS